MSEAKDSSLIDSVVGAFKARFSHPASAPSGNFTEHVTVLRFIADNQKLDRTFWPNTEMQAHIFRELLNDRLIIGDVVYGGPEGQEEGIYNAMITISGRAFISKHSQNRSDEGHTLIDYWKRANLGERFGMFCFFSVVFVCGFLVSKNEFVSRFIQLIRDVIP